MGWNTSVQYWMLEINIFYQNLQDSINLFLSLLFKIYLWNSPEHFKEISINTSLHQGWIWTVMFWLSLKSRSVYVMNIQIGARAYYWIIMNVLIFCNFKLTQNLFPQSCLIFLIEKVGKLKYLVKLPAATESLWILCSYVKRLYWMYWLNLCNAIHHFNTDRCKSPALNL